MLIPLSMLVHCLYKKHMSVDCNSTPQKSDGFTKWWWSLSVKYSVKWHCVICCHCAEYAEKIFQSLTVLLEGRFQGFIFQARLFVLLAKIQLNCPNSKSKNMQQKVACFGAFCPVIHLVLQLLNKTWLTIQKFVGRNSILIV